MLPLAICALCLHITLEPLACSGTLASAAKIGGERQFAATKRFGTGWAVQ
jgi:hypothetical protein